MASRKNDSNTTSKFILVIAGMLVLSALAYFSIKYFSEKGANQEKENKINQLNEEIVQLEEEIFSFKTELEQRDMDLATKEKMLDEKNVELESMINQLAAARKRDKSSTAKIRELETRVRELQAVMSKYEEDIAFLKNQNMVLTGQIDSLVVNETRLRSENTELIAQKDATTEELEKTVEMASVLRSTNFKYFNVNNRGKAKEDTEFRRFSFKNLKICFTIMENMIAPSGQREVYLVWENPDGTPNTNFTDGFSGTFFHEGNEKAFTARAVIDFNRLAQEVCVDYSPPDDDKQQKGVQNIYVYSEGSLIGQSNFVIK